MLNNSFQKKYKGKSVLVTGGNGFIGSRLIFALSGCDCHVHALVYGEGGYVFNNKKANVYKGDVRDKKLVTRIIKKAKPDFIFHLAASVDSGRDLQLTKEMTEVNILGTLNILEALEGIKISRMVFLGSCEEYGLGQSPFKETQPTMAISPYGFSKIAASGLCLIQSRFSDCPVVILRPTVVYGPGQKGKMFIPSLFRSLSENLIFEMSKGGQKRDFLFIDDLISAMLLAGAGNVKGEIINIGSGQSFPLKKATVMAKSLLKSKSKISFNLPYRPDEVMNYCCDISKAKKLLDWRPKYSLEKGLKEMAAGLTSKING